MARWSTLINVSGCFLFWDIGLYLIPALTTDVYVHYSRVWLGLCGKEYLLAAHKVTKAISTKLLKP